MNAPRRSTRNASCHHTNEKENTKNKKETGGKDMRDDEISEETQEEISTHNECDQDSRFSFDDDEEKTQQAMKIISKTGLNT